MPFWLHEHKLMLACKGQPLRYKFTAMGLVLGLLGLGWFIGIFIPWQRELHQKQCTYAALLEQKKIFQPAVMQYHCCCEQYEQLKQTYATLARDRSLQQVTNNLLSFMHKNNITCNAIERGQITDKGCYQRHNLTFVCKGAYCNFLAFLKMIDESKQPIECRSITMHKKKNRSLVCKLHVSMVSAKEELE